MTGSETTKQKEAKPWMRLNLSDRCFIRKLQLQVVMESRIAISSAVPNWVRSASILRTADVPAHASVTVCLFCLWTEYDVEGRNEGRACSSAQSPPAHLGYGSPARNIGGCVVARRLRSVALDVRRSLTPQKGLTRPLSLGRNMVASALPNMLS